MAAGNATIGALKVSLGLDSAQFEAGLKTASAGLSALAKVAGIAGIATGASLVAAATAIGVALKGTIDHIDELSKAAQKIGVPVAELSKLEHAAELSDVSLESLSVGLKRFSVNVDAAQTGTGKGADAFKRLGLSVTDAHGQLKPTSELIADVAGKFSGLQDGASKTAVAVALFGKNGSDLIPLLNEGRDGIKEMTDEADRLGLTIDERTGKSAEAFNDNIKRLGDALKGVFIRLATGLLPALDTLSNAMVAVTQDAGAMRAVGEALSLVLKVVGTQAIIVTEAFKGLWATVKGIVTAAGQVLSGNLGGAMATMGQKVTDLDDIGRRIREVWTGTGDSIVATAPKVSTQLAAPLVEGRKKVDEAAKKFAEGLKRAREEADATVAGLQHEADTFGMTAEQKAAYENRLKVATLLANGFHAQAAAAQAAAQSMENLKRVEDLANPANDNVGDITPAMNPKDIQTGIDKWRQFEEQLRRVRDVFYDMSDAVEQIFYGFKHNDWVSAVSGLVRAIDGVRAAFSAAGTAGDKIAAIAGVGNAVGGAIGGKAGSALSGAASGALVGAQLGSIVPGIGNVAGAVIGGALGLVGGLFGGSKAKKKAKAQAAAQAAAAAEAARQAAAEKAAQVAAANRELEIQLIELGGDAVKAEAERRKDLLASLDATTAALQAQVFAAQDLQAAEAALAEARAQFAGQAQDLNLEFLKATDAAAAAELERTQALAALPEQLRPLQQAIYDVNDASAALTAAQEAEAQAKQAAEQQADQARQAATQAYEQQVSVLQGAADRFRDLASSLAQFGRELNAAGVGGNLKQTLAVAAGAFRSVAARARAGDETALRDLPGAAKAFLDAQAAVAPNARSVAAARAEVQAAIGAAQAAAEGVAASFQQAIAQLQKTYGVELAIDDGVESLGERVLDLRAVIAAGQAAQTAAAERVATAQEALATATAAGRVAQEAAAAAVVSMNDRTATLPADIAAALAPYLTQVVVNTGQTARTLDDVSTGDLTLNVQAA